VALLILAIWVADYRLVFWLSIIPGVLAVVLIALFISADGPAPPMQAQFSWSLRGFDARFVGFLAVIGVFSLGNSSNAFLILKAQHAGMSPAWVSGVYLAFNATYVLVSIPSGIVADRLGRPPVILAGFILFAGVYAGFAVADSPWPIAGLFIFYGTYMGLSEGVQRAYLTTLVPEGRKATGFGLYHMVVGIAILPASVIAGFLWDRIGSAAPFWFGAGMATLAIILLAALLWRDGRTRDARTRQVA
jgi:predicted MFS family arabinose efflux permease